VPFSAFFAEELELLLLVNGVVMHPAAKEIVIKTTKLIVINRFMIMASFKIIRIGNVLASHRLVDKDISRKRCCERSQI
jgi:aspartyl/asparaginyl beta-hydroxylase (cupin superfamily)